MVRTDLSGLMRAFSYDEHFYKVIHDLIKEIPDCENISDNTWLWTKDETTHLERL